jgi:hypothetical protein
VARPETKQQTLYQRAVGEQLIAFLMPPEDPFVNPFGSGQVAWLIKRTSASSCSATKITEIGRDPFYFDANNKLLALTTSKHRSADQYTVLSLYPLP